MYDRIKKLCDIKGIPITKLCEQVTGSTGNLSTWKKNYMRSDYLSACANVLGCSVDYLRGRTDDPDDFSAELKEIQRILESLSVREKTELMTLIYDFADKKLMIHA